MKQLTVRLPDEELRQALEQRAAAANRSLNQVVVELLQGALGLPRGKRPRIGHGLDQFAGDMTATEAEELLATISVFEQIDDEMWS